MSRFASIALILSIGLFIGVAACGPRESPRVEEIEPATAPTAAEIEAATPGETIDPPGGGGVETGPEPVTRGSATPAVKKPVEPDEPQ
ncbi:MAG: hypothetical protein ACSLFQ_12350 [Thermoanaerobaculia bacterium]